MEKLFHHDYHKGGKQQEAQQNGQAKEPQKRESKVDKFMGYIKEDEKLDSRGKGVWWADVKSQRGSEAKFEQSDTIAIKSPGLL